MNRTKQQNMNEQNEQNVTHPADFTALCGVEPFGQQLVLDGKIIAQTKDTRHAKVLADGVKALALLNEKAHSLHRFGILRPCPFCGTNRTRIHEWILGAVIICECGGRGPEAYGETKMPMACDLWNRREQANA